MFTNIVQITNIFFKINYFAFSQVSITKSYNSKISLIHLHNIFEKPNIQPYVFKHRHTFFTGLNQMVKAILCPDNITFGPEHVRYNTLIKPFHDSRVTENKPIVMKKHYFMNCPSNCRAYVFLFLSCVLSHPPLFKK